uniref:Uncharacterized protein n=1 Tax=Rhizophora mucronata TaxID=61149 RepID=A0A2P2PEE3_RHIMU
MLMKLISLEQHLIYYRQLHSSMLKFMGCETKSMISMSVRHCQYQISVTRHQFYGMNSLSF